VAWGGGGEEIGGRHLPIGTNWVLHRVSFRGETIGGGRAERAVEPGSFLAA